MQPFTPTITGFSSNHTTQCEYEQAGNMVTFHIRIQRAPRKKPKGNRKRFKTTDQFRRRIPLKHWKPKRRKIVLPRPWRRSVHWSLSVAASFTINI